MSLSARLTKKYITDMLNSMCFSYSICWNGEDQFHQLPILKVEEEDKNVRTEQRGALLVHKYKNEALKLLVTASITNKIQVCYRIVGISEPIQIDDPKKTCYPLKSTSIDFSIADCNVGVENESSYCFSDNSEEESRERLFALLKFLLEIDFLAWEDKELFSSLLHDVKSLPPVPGDIHFRPIYGLKTAQISFDK